MERSKDWIDEAEGDLNHAKNDMEGKFYNWACFSAQQSAEKAVKAAFQKMGTEAWGHSVAEYPNAHPSGSPRRRYIKEESRRLIGYAEKIFQFCPDLLSEI